MQNFKSFLNENQQTFTQMMSEPLGIFEGYKEGKYPIMTKSFNVKPDDLSDFYLDDKGNYDPFLFLEKLNKEILPKKYKMLNVEARILGPYHADRIEVDLVYGILHNPLGSLLALNNFLDVFDEIVKQEIVYYTPYPASLWINSVPLSVKIDYPSEVNLDFRHNTSSGISLSGIDKFLNCQYILLSNGNKITSSMLSLLKIKSLKKLVNVAENDMVLLNILNKYIQGDKDILDCQEELISAGYKQYAKI